MTLYLTSSEERSVEFMEEIYLLGSGYGPNQIRDLLHLIFNKPPETFTANIRDKTSLLAATLMDGEKKGILHRFYSAMSQCDFGNHLQLPLINI